MSQPKPTRYARDTAKALEDLGFEVLDVSMTGKNHVPFKTRLRTLTGEHEKTFVTSGTPSVWRSDKKFLQEVRQWMATIPL